MTSGLLGSSLVALSPTALPRAAALTDALLAPPDALEPPVDEPFARELAQRVTGSLSRPRPVGPGSRPGTRPTVTGWTLRAGVDAPGRREEPFRWSPRTTRRALGITALRACVAGECRTPSEAVRLVTEQWVRRATQGLVGARSAEAWVSTLPAGGRAVVQAEAVRWATGLFTALEWGRLDDVEVGGLDRWWDVPGGGQAALRGRADVRAVAQGHPVLLCVGNGRPLPSSRAELLLPALVEVLRRPHGPAPSRVVGWWPASGRALVVTVGPQALIETARLVAQAVASATAKATDGPATVWEAA
jgi:hypothetical protein